LGELSQNCKINQFHKYERHIFVVPPAKSEALPQTKRKICRNCNTASSHLGAGQGYLFLRFLNKTTEVKAYKGYRVGTSACIFYLLNYCTKFYQICYW
jgi:hypothetical protein